MTSSAKKPAGESEAVAKRPRRPWRWAVRALLALVLMLGLLALPMACTTTVTPPNDPAEPRTVFLLDHGRTSSLVLPEEGGGIVRYAYGDWNYYALGNKDWGDGAEALFWPTAGALGRKRLEGPAEAGNVRARVGVPVEHLYPIRVAGPNLKNLRERLEELYRENLRTEVENPAAHLDFVRAPESYTYFHNSNHVVAGWLRGLGCEVSGPAFAARWEVGR